MQPKDNLKILSVVFDDQNTAVKLLFASSQMQESFTNLFINLSFLFSFISIVLVRQFYYVLPDTVRLFIYFYVNLKYLYISVPNIQHCQEITYRKLRPRRVYFASEMRASCLRHLVSIILCPSSCVHHLVSIILCPSSCVRPASKLRASCVHCAGTARALRGHCASVLQRTGAFCKAHVENNRVKNLVL